MLKRVTTKRIPFLFCHIPPSFRLIILNLVINKKKKKMGFPVSKPVTLVGDTADGGAVCNEGLSLEH